MMLVFAIAVVACLLGGRRATRRKTEHGTVGAGSIETQNGGLSFGPPKSDAGKRIVVFRKLITPVALPTACS